MTKLAKLSLAATVMVPASLAAQTVAPPVPWEDVPPAQLDVSDAMPAPSPPAPPPGVTWARPAPMPAPPPAQVRVAPAPVPVAPPAQVHAAPAPVPAAPSTLVTHERRVAVRTPAIRGVDRGYMMPAFWLGPQFYVRDWDAYGLAAPAPGERWIRYYDDALLVDRHGRVIDAHHGLDWDEQPWAPDPRGIPVYVGDGDFYPDAQDYAYVESYDDEAYADERYNEQDFGEYDYEYGGSDAHGGGYYGGYSYYPPPPYGNGAYGYGWGGVVVTETIVTTHGCCAEPKVVVKKYPAKKVRHYKRKRMPPRGERG